MDIDMNGLSVLDMGCGTAILAILAEMKGAMEIDAIDIDEWAVVNSVENISINGMNRIHAFKGTAENIPAKLYDVILANINRNILLSDMGIYASHLKPGGILILSGFYADDVTVLMTRIEESGLSVTKQMENNRWTALQTTKR